jgi:hypothetical protein
MLRLAGVATLALILVSGKATSHEFWIAPEMYRWPSGQAVLADLRVGDAFQGAVQSFVPQSFTRFEILTEDGAVEVEGRPGDVPALGGLELPEGLAVIVHETAAGASTWDKWERFAAFADRRGLGDVIALDEASAMNRPEVREEYVRYAKSLVAIGHGAGADRNVGLRTEIVALANPYTDDLAGAMPLQLFLDGAPRRMAQVEVFSRPAGGGPVERTVYETDSNGIVVLPIETGCEYFVSAVALEPVDPATEAKETAYLRAEWRTLWASLTFEIPRPQPAP